MINEEEKFDDLLRTKMSEREFFFDEENWQKLNEKIEKDEKRKKQTRTALIFLGGLIIGIGLTIPLMNLFKTSNNILSNTQGSTITNPIVNNQSVAVTNNTVQAGSSTQPVVGAGSSASTPIGENVNTTGKVDNNAPAENNSVASAPVEKALATNNSAQVKHSSANNSIVNNNSVAFNSTQPAASVRRHRNVASNNNSTVNNAVAVNTNQPVASGRRHRNNAATPNSSINKTVVAATPGNTNTTTAQTSGDESTGSKNATGNTQPGSQGNQTTVPSSAATAQANGTTPSKTETGNSSQTNSSGQQTVQANGTTPAKTELGGTSQTTGSGAQTGTNKVADSGSQKPETASVTDQLPDVKTPARLKASNTLSIDAGAAYSFGWKNFGVTEANGLSPVFGVSVTRTLSSKFAISLGVQYNSLNGLKTGYSNSVTSYDFGSKDSSTTVTPKTLQYITLPLSFRYLIDDNDAICLGGSFGYLLNVSSTVTTTTQTELSTSPTIKTQTANGYTGGFNTFDIQLRLAYRRRIYKAFSASIEGYFGLTDDESGTYFDNTFKRNSGARLIFSYDLLK